MADRALPPMNRAWASVAAGVAGKGEADGVSGEADVMQNGLALRRDPLATQRNR